MKRVASILLFICIAALHVSGQYNTNQNKKWAFGHNAGLDFMPGAPIPFLSSIFTSEGSAAVCDTAGNMLFYTNGKTVYNRLGIVMPTGASIVPYMVTSTTQAAAIAPVIGTTNRYYIFSLESFESSGTSAAYSILAWSMVDMTLDGGYGDVIASSMGTVFAHLLTEKMITIQGDNCDIWLLTHRRDSSIFQAYNISGAGFNTIPVSSTIGPHTGNMQLGAMKVSPDRSKIGYQYMHTGAAAPGTFGGCELYDFNPSTGIVSNCRVLDSLHTNYGGEFSPDNTKLYTSRIETGTNISQYDITLPSAAAIRASRIDVYSVPSVSYSDLRLAPDGKIYNGSIPYAANFVDCINFPNLSGAACNYVHHALNILPGSYSLSFGNIYTNPASSPSYISTHHDITECIPAGDSITIFPTATGTNYVWFDGVNTLEHKVGAYGAYWVKVANGCTITIDTVHVAIAYDTFYQHNDTSICITPHGEIGVDTVLLWAPSAGSYHWSDGSGSATMPITTGGTYWVAYINDCSYTIDTFHVSIFYNQVIYGSDSVCEGNTTVFTPLSAGGTWSSGSPGIATVNATGTVTGIAPGIATIIYTLPPGCDTSKNIVVTAPPCTTGISIMRNSETTQVYPNPAHDQLTITSEAEINSIIITDLVGQQVYSNSYHNTMVQVSLADLLNGIYFVKINGAVTRKFVKL